MGREGEGETSLKHFLKESRDPGGESPLEVPPTGDLDLDLDLGGEGLSLSCRARSLSALEKVLVKALCLRCSSLWVAREGREAAEALDLLEEAVGHCRDEVPFPGDMDGDGDLPAPSAILATCAVTHVSPRASDDRLAPPTQPAIRKMTLLPPAACPDAKRRDRCTLGLLLNLGG